MAAGDQWWAAVAGGAAGTGGVVKGAGGKGRAGAAVTGLAEPAVGEKKGKRQETGMLSVNTYRLLNKAFH